MYSVRAQDVKDALSSLPSDAYDQEMVDFNPYAVCSVSIEPTAQGKGLLLIADTGLYRVLVSPDYSPRVLKSLKTSGSYAKEDTGGKIRWAMARAKAATAAA